jgi:ADP-ribose pyrophosphatase YjhB (NUDIX family)
MTEETDRHEVTRVGAYALCTDDRQRILLCRLADGIIKAGSWTLPGGGIEFGEAPTTAALRELLEETGLAGEINGLATVESFVRRGPLPGAASDDFHAIQIVYRVRITGGELRDERHGTTDAARWFARDELGDVPLVELATKAVRLAFD